MYMPVAATAAVLIVHLIDQLQVAFGSAVERANSFTKMPTHAERLSLYGLYKQGIVGDCNTERPGMLDFKGRAKWDAWNKNKGMNKEDAQKEYISLVEKLSVSYA